MGLIKRTARKQARRASVKCGTCGKRYTNPLTHVCTPKSDFKSRTRAAERERKREAARKRRREAADRRKAAAAERRKRARAKRSAARRPSARPAHDYHLCRDEDCTRTACRAYAEGMIACPREHV